MRGISFPSGLPMRRQALRTQRGASHHAGSSLLAFVSRRLPALGQRSFLYAQRVRFHPFGFENKSTRSAWRRACLRAAAIVRCRRVRVSLGLVRRVSPLGATEKLARLVAAFIGLVVADSLYCCFDRTLTAVGSYRCAASARLRR